MNRNEFLTKRPAYKIASASFSGDVDTVTADDAIRTNTARLFYNLSASSRSLKDCGGFCQLSLPADVNGVSSTYPVELEGKAILNCYYFRHKNSLSGLSDDRIILYADDNKLYQLYLSNPTLGATQISGLTFATAPNALNYKLNDVDVLLISSSDSFLTVYDGENAPYQITTAPKITSMCVHYERLYGAGVDNTLWFSDDLDPTNWNISYDQAGYIEFADELGAPQKVVSFLDYLYVFRKYGITRLSAYSAQEDFYATQLYTASGSIYPDTVSVCGDKILFLSSDGLYLFDGMDTKKILPSLDGLFDGVDNSNASACFYEGKYILAARANFNDGRRELCENDSYVNNAVITVELSGGNVGIMRGMDCVSVNVGRGDNFNRPLYCFRNSQSNKVGVSCASSQFFGEPLPKCYVFATTDYGLPNTQKILRYLTIKTATNITFVVKADGNDYFFDVCGGERSQKVPLNVRGYEFQITILSDSELLKVESGQITYVYY